MTKDMKSLFKEAAEIAAEVPETMHAAAFNRALDMVMQERGLTEESPTAPRPRKPRKSKGRRARAPARQPQENGRTPRRRRSGRPGPKAIIEDLLDTGFFSQGRTISQVQKHLQKAEGRPYKPNDLSPALLRLVREKKLARDENADGQYEYKAR